MISFELANQIFGRTNNHGSLLAIPPVYANNGFKYQQKVLNTIQSVEFLTRKGLTYEKVPATYPHKQLLPYKTTFKSIKH